MPDKHKNFIGGEWMEPTTGEYFENRNPAKQSDLIGLWPRSGREDVDRAVEQATVSHVDAGEKPIAQRFRAR